MGDSMSTIINATTTNGVVIQPDNSGSLVLQTNSGTTALTISTAQNATFAGTVTVPTGTIYPLVSGTALATTSGTAKDFTSIPSWVKRITVMFYGVSTNGASRILVRIGTGGTPATSGYIAQSSVVYTNVATMAETSGFVIYYDTASFTITGSIIIQNISGNIWVMSGCGSNTGGVAFNWLSGGNVSLAGVLDVIRITTLNGTDTFDAGSVNILYE
jgi:hypothetical protein